MTLNRARKLLGKLGEQYSDEQVLALVKMVKSFSDKCVDVINHKIQSGDGEFLSGGKCSRMVVSESNNISKSI